MIAPLIGLVGLLAAPAYAAEPSAATDPSSEPTFAPSQVFVSAFQAGDKASSGLATLLETQIATHLAGESTVEVLRVEDAPPFPDYDARVYVESCPSGDAVPCALVLGARVHARYAVTGTVLTLASGSRVRVSILDIANAREAVAFTYELGADDDGKLADAVARVLVAVREGRIGREDDIRDTNDTRGDDEEDAPELTNDELAAQLRELAPQLAAAQDVATGTRNSIAERTYTRDDLAGGSEEGAKPWELAGMTPGAWLRYKNSGLPMFEWKTRAMGHQFQLLIRVGGGWWRGPALTEYTNRHVFDTNLQVIDSYTSQAALARGVPSGGGELAFGLLPGLDVGGAIGLAPGQMVVDVGEEDPDPGAIAPPLTVYPAVLWFGPRAEVTFLPAGNVHPAIGFGATFTPTPQVDKYAGVPEYSAVFPSKMLIYAELWPGVQLRLSKYIDAYARVPIDLLLAGPATQEFRDTPLEQFTPTSPVSDVQVGVGAQVGLQIRLFGAHPKEAPMRDEP